ncbi:MAG: hypothetical protein IMZ67_09185 [Acidobacteria bacterium]|nr:hypothetical protein [Acidobacteriota bacterium]
MRVPVLSVNFVDETGFRTPPSLMPEGASRGSMAFMDTCATHNHECTVCDGPTHAPRGVILERLCPGALFCDGCGRRVVRCECVA